MPLPTKVFYYDSSLSGMVTVVLRVPEARHRRHAWVSTTQIYTHVVNEDVKRAMQG
jgi:hypothetical protein